MIKIIAALKKSNKTDLIKKILMILAEDRSI